MDTSRERPTASHRSRLSLGSALAFVIGATIMILLHETSHAVTGALLGFHPLQLPFGVDYTPAPPPELHVLTLLAGPAFSLVSGVIGVVVDRVVTPFRDRPFWRLVWLWTIFTSIQEGLGYLQVTALMPAGDTAQALTLLGAPTGVFIAVTVIGWLGLTVTAWLFAAPIRQLAASHRDRTDLAVWAWLIGTGALLVLMTVYVVLSPIDDSGAVTAVLAGAAAIGVFAPMSMMFRAGAGAETAPQFRWPHLGGLVLLAVLIAVNLVLTRGWFWL